MRYKSAAEIDAELAVIKYMDEVYDKTPPYKPMNTKAFAGGYTRYKEGERK